jgi:hypothetical protein
VTDGRLAHAHALGERSSCADRALAPHRMVRGTISYVIVVVIAAVLIQVFTPFPAATWLSQLIVRLAVAAPLLFIIVATAAAATVYGFVKLHQRAPRATIPSPPIPSVR